MTPHSAAKPPLFPRKAASDPTQRSSRVQVSEIPRMDTSWILTTGLSTTPPANPNKLPMVNNNTPSPKFDKTPYDTTPLNDGSPSGLLTQLSECKLNTYQTSITKSSPPTTSPGVRHLRQSVLPIGLNTSIPQLYGSPSAPSEFEVTRQYPISPFSEDELLQKNIDYKYEDTVKYNWRGHGFNYGSKGMVPPYMDRVIYAWQSGLILKNQEYVFKHGQYEVSRRDAHAILYGHVVSTQVMDSLMYILHRFNRNPGATWTFVRCTHTSTVPHMSATTMLLPEYKAYTKDAMQGSRWIMLPVLSLSHWVLVVFDFYDREVKVYNSMPDSDRFRLAVRQVTNLWKPFLRNAMKRDDVMKFLPVVKYSPSLHNKRDDTGLYIVKIIDCIVGRRSVNFNDDSIKADRGRIVYNLIASSYFPGSFDIVTD